MQLRNFVVKQALSGAGPVGLWITSLDPTKEYNLCGMCQVWMGVPMDKVVFEMVEFKGGQVNISTTNDAEVLTQLHAIADRTIEEYSAMMKEHEGHEH